MVVIGDWTTPPFNQLKDALIKERISDCENIKVLSHASVPIIKILEPHTELKIDISFNTVIGVKSAELIKKFLVEYPCLRPLVMVLKQFLIQRDFNEVWTGGIGSYSLILMTVSFLQLHARIDPTQPVEHVNLGVLLIEFFELYGRCFNYMKTAIRIQNGGSYVPKDELLKQFTNTSGQWPPRTSVLCIEDPLNPHNDIGKVRILFF
jgi:non-canonical poly(A) RNA polymerase PAPD5/7